MNRIAHWVALSVIGISGCVSPAPDLGSYKPSISKLPIEKIVVTDLTVDSIQSSSNAYMYSRSGFARLPDSVSSPPFRMVLVNAVRNGLASVGTSGAGILEFSILRGELFVELSMGNRVTMSDIFPRARQFRCVLDLNLRFRDGSSRKTFEAISIANYSWGDLKTEDRRRIIEECTDNLIDAVKTHALSFVKG
jgi:hypothetical protein